MPKKVDPALRERAVRLVVERQRETAAAAAVARQLGAGKESVRRWVIQSARGHEKVPTGGQVEVPSFGQMKVPTLCSSC